MRRNVGYVFLALMAFAIGCFKNNTGDTGPYPNLGTNWWGAVMQTEENGMAMTDPSWGPVLDINVVQHGNTTGETSASASLLGGLTVKMMTPEAATDLEINYVERTHDSNWGITTTVTYSGGGVLSDENNATFSLSADVQDDLFGPYSGAYEIKMTRLDENFAPIDDRVDVDSSDSTSSALMSSETREYMEYGVDWQVLDHLHLISNTAPIFMRDEMYLALLSNYLR